MTSWDHETGDLDGEPVTGEATPLVDLDESDETSDFYDLATDPVSGTSYAIGQITTLAAPPSPRPSTSREGPSPTRPAPS